MTLCDVVMLDAAEGDDVGWSFLRMVGQAQRVADIVRHVLDVARLIVVGEDYSVACLLQGEDFLLQVERGSGGGHGRTLAGAVGLDNVGLVKSVLLSERIR